MPLALGLPTARWAAAVTVAVLRLPRLAAAFDRFTQAGYSSVIAATGCGLGTS